MAIAIKQIPVLNGKVASSFVKKANANVSKKHSVDFSAQAIIAKSIFSKAKI